MHGLVDLQDGVPAHPRCSPLFHVAVAQLLWLARYDKLIYGIILVGILAGLAWRLITP